MKKGLGTKIDHVNTSPFVTGLIVLDWPICSWTQSLAALCFRYFCRLVNMRLHFPHWNRSGSLSSPSDSCPTKQQKTPKLSARREEDIPFKLLSNIGDKIRRLGQISLTGFCFPATSGGWQPRFQRREEDWERGWRVTHTCLWPIQSYHYCISLSSSFMLYFVINLNEYGSIGLFIAY